MVMVMVMVMAMAMAMAMAMVPVANVGMLQKLVVKPDQLIKRRGKLGLIKVNVDFPTVKSWVIERMGQDQVTYPSSQTRVIICLSR